MNERELNSKIEFYYCYSNKIKEYLLSKGFSYVNIALNPDTHNKYWLFVRNNELTKSLDNYYMK